MVGEREGNVQVLLDEDRREPSFLEACDRLRDPIDDEGREPFGRLVDEEHAWVREQGATDREHLLLTAGELVAAIAPALVQTWKQHVDVVEAPARRSRPADRLAGELRFSSTVSGAKIRRP